MCRGDDGSAAGAAGSRDWFSLTVLEWMWSPDGLGLRPGADLMVYATIYRASAHGGGAYAATNESMGRALGYPRETVSRSVNRLARAGLVASVGEVPAPGGGRPVKWYAVSRAAIDRAQSRMCASALGLERASGDDGRQGAPDGDAGPLGRGGRRKGADVTERHAEGARRDGTSRRPCDGTSRVTERHVAENGPSAAATGVFDNSPISTYHLSTDQGEAAARLGGAEAAARAGDAAPAPLGEGNEAAFRKLVSMSLRPVDPDYVDANRREFRRLLSEGVEAGVILTAYEEYAAYQRRVSFETGESRPMHLLNWLGQSPNTNIRYVLNRMDSERARALGREARRASGTRTGTSRGKAPTHGSPRLERCRDGGVAVWFVTDDRGCRRVAGSRGVESATRARALYEAMYESEGRA